ncbi:septum formation initiator family protein [Jatrophihabitans telluris]|uniref:Septum formation initiator family protein n=1 Tax=Jatrophihabitans telluris TaxID=2038343 RepID=A0ABY4R233_9ACTN|nr:septum formation initiator family protein [Jatrophihabitans telluris]UQX89382.1 septum formation initiator family protein [Jatrophihabitans telluris]
MAVLRRPRFTGRSMVITAMALFLVVVLASPVQTYLNRRDTLAATEKQQRQLQAKVTELQHQSSQWADPAYVEREARSRLQYVRPGDTLYTVLNADGSPKAADGTNPPASGVARAGHQGSWNATLWGSVRNADAAS